MKVKYIDNTYISAALTIGKIYEVFEKNDERYFIYNDNNIKGEYLCMRFSIVEEEDSRIPIKISKVYNIDTENSFESKKGCIRNHIYKTLNKVNNTSFATTGLLNFIEYNKDTIKNIINMFENPDECFKEVE